MAIFEGLIGLGIALLLAPAIAEYAKLRRKGEKGFGWVAASGVFFLFAGTFALTPTLGTYVGADVWSGVGTVFEVIGWILALIGTIFVGYEMLVEK